MIKILKMTQDGFDHYMLSAIKNYANEKVNNGTWESKDALSNSKKQYALLLPTGFKLLIIIFTQFLIKKKKSDISGWPKMMKISRAHSSMILKFMKNFKI